MKLLVVLCLAVAAVALAEAAKEAAHISAGTWASPSGAQVQIQSDYWANPCRIEQGKASHPGLHELYEDADWRWCVADTPELVRQGVTKATQSVFYTDKGAARQAELTKADRARYSLEEIRRARPAKLIAFSLRCNLEGADHIFVAGISGSPGEAIPMQDMRPPFTVWVCKFEEGRWRVEGTLSKHPIARELSAGRFKQFGAPADVVSADPARASAPTTMPAGK